MVSGRLRVIVVMLFIGAVLFFGCGKNPVFESDQGSTGNEQQTQNEPGTQEPQQETQGPQQEKRQPQLITLDPEDFGVAALVEHKWEFTSVPEGAGVYLNGKRVGQTPFIMEQLPPAGTVLSLIKEGYCWHHQQLGKDKPGNSSVNLRPGNWASEEEVIKAIDEINLQLAAVKEGQWQMELGHMQVEQFSPNPAGDSAVLFLERRIPEDARPSEVTTFIRITALLRFSPEMSLQILECRPIYVGRDMFFTRILGWLGNDSLLYLEDASEPQGKDPFYQGTALQVLQISSGEKKTLHWIPPAITIGYNSWLSEKKDVLYFATSGGYYRGAIGSIRLDTGEYRLIKKDLDLYRPYEELLLEKSASGEKVVHLLNYREDMVMPIFNLLTGGETNLTPKGVVALRPVWSPRGSLLAVKVGEPGQTYEIMWTEGGAFLEAGAIWIINDEGKRVSCVEVPGKQVSNPLWLPDGQSLVFQIEQRTELTPEEAEMLPDDWKLSWKEIYRSDLTGELTRLSLPEDGNYRLEDVLDEEWLLAVNYPQDRTNYILVSTSGKEVVNLPQGTRQVLGMAGKRVVTWADGGQILIGYPGQELESIAVLDALLSYYWIIEDKRLVLVDMGKNIADPSSLRVIKLF